MYLEIFLADFAVFRVFLRISRDFAEIPEYFAGPRPREISEALSKVSATLTSLLFESNYTCTVPSVYDS